MPVKLGTALPDEIAVFDTETDGVDVETCHIVTAFIGVMNVKTEEITERWSWLINTGHEIPAGAIAVHGITNEKMRADGMDAARGVYEITQRLDILQRRGLCTVVMNAPYDYTLLDREMWRHWSKMRPLEPMNVFDPMVFDRAVAKYRRGTRKLVDLAAVYGVPVETNAHDAEADCRMAGRVAIKLLGHSKLADLTLSEVHAKLIPTARNNALGLASYWETKKMKTLTDQGERAALLASIKDVRTNGIYWPMRPRPTTEGVGNDE